MKKIYSSLFVLFTFALGLSAQDDCATATNATVGSSCSYITFNLPGTLTQSTPAPTGCNVANLKDDAWLVFTATGTSTIIQYLNSSRDAAIWVYSGTCGSLTQIGCVDAVAGIGTEAITVTTTPSTVYYVRIGRMLGNNGANMNGSYCIYSVNDDCASAMPLTPGVSCVYTAGTVSGATASAGVPAPTCATTSADDDVWYSFVATATSHPISVQGSSGFDPVIQVLSGACAGLTQIACQNATGNGGLETVTVTGLTIGLTYYIRIFSFGTTVPSTLTFDVCVAGGSSGLSCPGSLGLGTTSVASLPYTHSAQTTCGKANDITSTNVSAVCGSSLYYGGEDVVYYFTPTTSGQITITLTSTGSWTGMMLYAGCPFSVGSTCVGTEQSSTGNKSMCVNVTSGITYYLIIDSWPTPTCNPYSVTISAPVVGGTGATCATAVPMGALPYSATGQTTACFGNDYTNASTGSCASLYESGEDKVYSITVAAATCLGITLSNVSTTSIGFQVYSGCPGVGGTTCVGNAGGATSGILSGTVVLPAAGTYYIIVDTWSTPFNCTYDIAVINQGGSPLNDLPCAAIPLTMNVYEPGDNGCSGNASEPATPSCWSSGSVNTVWYTFVPTSTSVKLATLLGSLQNTQIAVYSGACGSLTQIACNDNAPACGSSTNNASQITVTGLTIGVTYYVSVDGSGSATGTFSFLVIDGAATYPSVAGMDCGLPNPVCAQQFSVANPGYSGYGNLCDFGSGYCLASGERNVVWYTIPINAAGNLEFDLVPNDFNCTLEDETDYDFAVWKIAGSGSVTCTQIAAGTAIPLRCNYSGLGVTGLNAATGNAPASLSATVCPMCGACGAYSPTPTYDGAYENNIAVANGDIYLLAVSNFSNSTSGFAIDFKASPIGYTGSSATAVTWTGGANTTAFTNTANWGGCNIPSCTVDAIIAPFSVQPVISANQTVKNLIIQPGATLTIASGITLTVCGNVTNSGTLTMQPNSTILFNNTAIHTMTGAFTGANKIWNLTVTQTAGSVILNANMDLGGNFTTSNATSVFNTNGNYIKVAGNFANADGSNTFTNVGTIGTLEFNGTAAQTYNQGTSTLTLNNVLMNHTGPGVTALTNMVIGTSGTLTLTLGRIITNANEVQVTNTANASCTAGNASSFVQGNLRRYLNGAAGAYNFPVGHATPGYERASISFTTTTTIPQLLARFDTWPTLPTGPAASECPTNTYNVLNAENHGYWTITASANPTSGNYDITLYNVGYTNSAGAAGWTVMKAPTISGTWGLNGTCVATSTAAITSRTGLNGFSVFSTAQSVSPLPIELLSFDGTATADYNHLEWITAVENNNDYFTLERSTDGVNFTEIARIDGAGNSTQLINYSFNDMNPADGYNYYRLKQTDFNGQYTYSNVVPLTFHRGNMLVENVRPNPTNGNINFDFASPDDTEIHYIITDVTGRVIVDEKTTIKAGRTTLATSIASEGAGVYSLKIIESKHGFISVTRIVKF
jgi:hypothetical protein